jgi:hypothetical protein
MISIVPRNDERRHELVTTCWCNPRVDWLDPDTGLPWVSGMGPRVIHNAADSRETSEEITGESMAPGKGWEIVTH